MLKTARVTRRLLRVARDHDDAHARLGTAQDRRGRLGARRVLADSSEGGGGKRAVWSEEEGGGGKRSARSRARKVEGDTKKRLIAGTHVHTHTHIPRRLAIHASRRLDAGEPAEHEPLF